MDNYLIQYKDLATLTISQMLEKLKEINGKQLSELKLKDLTYHNSKKIWPGEGVYLFREGANIIYVGKVTSMSFTERIPKHFDFRSHAWFNSLLKTICKGVLEKEWNNEAAGEASLLAFKNYNLVLINFVESHKINRIETLLRAGAKPLNAFKTKQVTDYEQIVNNY